MNERGAFRVLGRIDAACERRDAGPDILTHDDGDRGPETSMRPLLISRIPYKNNANPPKRVTIAKISMITFGS